MKKLGTGEPSHANQLGAKIREIEARGFEPILICFRDDSGEIEILTRGGLVLRDFVAWLGDVWIPNSYDRTRDHGH